jgi:murein L,D-transpeptidase YafK
MSRFVPTIAAMAVLATVAGCTSESPKHLQPLSYQMQARLALKGLEADAPILLRVFKEESELEVWKRNDAGRYEHVKTYPICKWSGALGPKQKEGDRQAPEGFYTIRPAQMNPLSNYYLSFNIGYPNTYDRAFGRTGANLMVHGACSSAGCYSMTDEYIAEIYALAREAFDGGQQEFQLQAFPFRMTDENMKRHKDSRWYDFWVNLKQGYDAFEAVWQPPKVDVCGKHYVFNASFTVPHDRVDPSLPCPAYVALAAPPGQSATPAPATRVVARRRDPAASVNVSAAAPPPATEEPVVTGSIAPAPAPAPARAQVPVESSSDSAAPVTVRVRPSLLERALGPLY